MYYKKARLDGWDFYTGNTINYRENIGKTVTVPNRKGKPELCSSNVIHASWNPNCFIGAKIPCSVFIVLGKAVVKDCEKAGFRQLKIIEEIPQEKLDCLFGWKYSKAVNPINPFTIKPPKIDENVIELLKSWASVGDSVGDSVWDSVRDSVWASVGDSVGDSVWDSVWDSVGDSVWDSVGAYIGTLFPNIKAWKYTQHKKNEYPFQSAVDLWKIGLVPSFDGKTWRLHGTSEAKVLYQMEA